MIQFFGVQTVTKRFLLTNTLNFPTHGKHFRSAGTTCCRREDCRSFKRKRYQIYWPVEFKVKTLCTILTQMIKIDYL